MWNSDLPFLSPLFKHLRQTLTQKGTRGLWVGKEMEAWGYMSRHGASSAALHH